jgi:DNA primase small subunit
MMWVFSGRRGIHCWIGDEVARTMNNEMRTAVVDYVHLSAGNEMGGGLELSYPLHPALDRAFKLLDRHFEKIIIHD